MARTATNLIWPKKIQSRVIAANFFHEEEKVGQNAGPRTRKMLARHR